MGSRKITKKENKKPRYRKMSSKNTEYFSSAPKDKDESLKISKSQFGRCTNTNSANKPTVSQQPQHVDNKNFDLGLNKIKKKENKKPRLPKISFKQTENFSNAPKDKNKSLKISKTLFRRCTKSNNTNSTNKPTILPQLQDVDNNKTFDLALNVIKKEYRKPKYQKILPNKIEDVSKASKDKDESPLISQTLKSQFGNYINADNTNSTNKPTISQQPQHVDNKNLDCGLNKIEKKENRKRRLPKISFKEIEFFSNAPKDKSESLKISKSPFGRCTKSNNRNSTNKQTILQQLQDVDNNKTFDLALNKIEKEYIKPKHQKILPKKTEDVSKAPKDKDESPLISQTLKSQFGNYINADNTNSTNKPTISQQPQHVDNKNLDCGLNKIEKKENRKRRLPKISFKEIEFFSNAPKDKSESLKISKSPFGRCTKSNNRNSTNKQTILQQLQDVDNNKTFDLALNKIEKEYIKPKHQKILPKKTEDVSKAPKDKDESPLISQTLKSQFGNYINANNTNSSNKPTISQHPQHVDNKNFDLGLSKIEKENRKPRLPKVSFKIIEFFPNAPKDKNESLKISKGPFGRCTKSNNTNSTNKPTILQQLQDVGNNKIIDLALNVMEKEYIKPKHQKILPKKTEDVSKAPMDKDESPLISQILKNQFGNYINANNTNSTNKPTISQQLQNVDNKNKKIKEAPENKLISSKNQEHINSSRSPSNSKYSSISKTLYNGLVLNKITDSKKLQLLNASKPNFLRQLQDVGNKNLQKLKEKPKHSGISIDSQNIHKIAIEDLECTIPKKNNKVSKPNYSPSSVNLVQDIKIVQDIVECFKNESNLQKKPDPGSDSSENYNIEKLSQFKFNDLTIQSELNFTDKVCQNQSNSIPQQMNFAPEFKNQKQIYNFPNQIPKQSKSFKNDSILFDEKDSIYDNIYGETIKSSPSIDNVGNDLKGGNTDTDTNFQVEMNPFNNVTSNLNRNTCCQSELNLSTKTYVNHEKTDEINRKSCSQTNFKELDKDKQIQLEEYVDNKITNPIKCTENLFEKLYNNNIHETEEIEGSLKKTHSFKNKTCKQLSSKKKEIIKASFAMPNQFEKLQSNRKIDTLDENLDTEQNVLINKKPKSSLKSKIVKKKNRNLNPILTPRIFNVNLLWKRDTSLGCECNSGEKFQNPFFSDISEEIVDEKIVTLKRSTLYNGKAFREHEITFSELDRLQHIVTTLKPIIYVKEFVTFTSECIGCAYRIVVQLVKDSKTVGSYVKRYCFTEKPDRKILLEMRISNYQEFDKIYYTHVLDPAPTKKLTSKEVFSVNISESLLMFPFETIQWTTPGPKVIVEKVGELPKLWISRD